ncbi:MAG: protein kinase [Vicinamibacterales bacterium]
MTVHPSDIKQLGGYEIRGRLGAGGMGEVYRARDTRLGRDVAVKILPTAVRDDPAHLARFEREARLLAAVNHPHIATIFGVEEDSGIRALVMELVEGETLASFLSKGPLPVPEVIRLGSQIADALSAAHAKDIVHRDLKPANIMLAKSGVKVLDFGLAKPTGSRAETTLVTGGIVGTPAYMAPEQLAGASVDTRTDVFALGLVLQEMATGRRILVGHGESPSLEGVPDRLAHVIERCLARDPGDRWQAASDVRRELEWAGRTAATRATSQSAPRGWSVVHKAAAAVIPPLALVGGLAAWRLAATPAPTPQPVMRTTIALPSGLRLESSVPLAISPDGSQLAFVAIDENGDRQLYLRPLASDDAKPLAGTAGARHPFFSPDGRSVGFFTDGALQRVDLDDGAVFRLCPVPGVDIGGAWGIDTIVVAIRGSGLFKVNAAGGTLERIESVSGARYPSFLPDGRTVLYASVSASPLNSATGFAVVSLDGTGLRDIARLSDTDGAGAPVLGATAEVSQAAFLSSGYLVFGQDPGFVRALPIDLQTLEVTGRVTTLGASVERAANAGGIAFAISRTGLLVFAGSGNEHALVWVNRQGITTPVTDQKAAYRFPRLSPDGKTVVVSINDETRTPRAWLIDLARGTRTPLGIGAINTAWSPDGRRIAYGINSLVTQSVDGSPPTIVVPQDVIRMRTQPGTSPYPTSWSSDGRDLFFQADNQQAWRLSVSDGRLEQILDGPGAEFQPAIAPDSRAIAYVSTESGRAEVYIAAWPSLDGRHAVSTQGGMFPWWSPDSRELFFWRNQTLMAATVDRAFNASEPRPLFSGAYVGAARDRSFDVARDGRFLMVKSDERAELRQITVVQNWWAASAGTSE